MHIRERIFSVFRGCHKAIQVREKAYLAVGYATKLGVLELRFTTAAVRTAYRPGSVKKQIDATTA